MLPSVPPAHRSLLGALHLLLPIHICACSKAPQGQSLFLGPMSSSCHCPSQSNFMNQLSAYCLPGASQPHATAAEAVLGKSTPVSSVLFSPMAFTLLEVRVAIHQSPLPVSLLLFPGQYFVSGSGGQGIASPGTILSFFLHKHLVISNLPFRSLLRARFLVPSDRSTGLPVLSVSGNYHRLQLAVLWASYTPLPP